MAGAIAQGDAEQAVVCVHGVRKWAATVEAEARLTKAIREFREQLVLTFGDDAWEQYRRADVSPSFDLFEPDPLWAYSVEISMIGEDRAQTRHHPATGREIHILRTKAGWKIHVESMFLPNVRPQEIVRDLNSITDHVRQATTMAADRRKSVAEIKQWLGAAMW